MPAANVIATVAILISTLALEKTARAPPLVTATVLSIAARNAPSALHVMQTSTGDLSTAMRLHCQRKFERCRSSIRSPSIHRHALLELHVIYNLVALGVVEAFIGSPSITIMF